jgi:LSD1 subclass zinc finger protein
MLRLLLGWSMRIARAAGKSRLLSETPPVRTCFAGRPCKQVQVPACSVFYLRNGTTREIRVGTLAGCPESLCPRPRYAPRIFLSCSAWVPRCFCGCGVADKDAARRALGRDSLMISQMCRRVLRVDFGFREVRCSWCAAQSRMACFVDAWLLFIRILCDIVCSCSNCRCALTAW